MKNVQMLPFTEKRFAREAQFKRESIFKRMKIKIRSHRATDQILHYLTPKS